MLDPRQNGYRRDWSAGPVGLRGKQTCRYWLLESVALDYVSRGIRVNVVAPDMTETDMMLKRATGGKPENIAKAVSGAPIAALTNLMRSQMRSHG
jgi:NAD(P)-dependent dehydrogenase (short-subunit alcohol dehydrogenase family)